MREQLETALDGRYTIERELGRGGMATVWLGRDTRLDRDVAIKLLHPELAGAIGVERFAREVRVTARLNHPGVVPVLDSGVIELDGDAIPWYAMPYVRGESLRERLLRERQLPVEEVVHIASEIAAALAEAHAEGVVHRDIKPENVLLAERRVCVLDFGIAKALLRTGHERLTTTGVIIGTAAYMSPEQAAGDTVDARSDQYSLATMVYEMLAGEPPFAGATVQAALSRRLSESPRPLRSVRPSLPPHMESAVLRGLSRVPADRFPDVSAFARALRGEESGRVAAYPPPGAGAAAAPAVRGGRQPVYIAAAMVVILSLAGLVWTGNGRRAQHPAADTLVVAAWEQGMRAYDQRTPDGNTEAIELFRSAVRRDSTFAPAWNGLAKAYIRAYHRPYPVPEVAHDELPRLAVDAVERALAIDPRTADAWLTQAIVQRSIDPTDMAPPLRAVRTSLSLDSSVAEAWHTLAVSLAEDGDGDAALTMWRRAVAVNGRYREGLVFLALAHYWRRQYDSAAVWLDSAVRVSPNYGLARHAAGLVELERGELLRARAAFDAAQRIGDGAELAYALSGNALAAARSGEAAKARHALGRAESVMRAFTPAPLHGVVFISQAHAALGDRERAIALLAGFESPRNLHFQLHLRCDPPFDPLRGDPRFRRLVADIGPRSC